MTAAFWKPDSMLGALHQLTEEIFKVEGNVRAATSPVTMPGPAASQHLTSSHSIEAEIENFVLCFKQAYPSWEESYSQVTHSRSEVAFPRVQQDMMNSGVRRIVNKKGKF